MYITQFMHMVWQNNEGALYYHVKIVLRIFILYHMYIVQFTYIFWQNNHLILFILLFITAYNSEDVIREIAYLIDTKQ